MVCLNLRASASSRSWSGRSLNLFIWRRRTLERGAPAYGLRVALRHGEPFEVDPILRAIGNPLHLEQVPERADGDGDTVDWSSQRAANEVVVGQVAGNPWDPLHHVKVAERGLEPEVAAFGELTGIRRIERELLRSEVAEAGMPSSEVGKHRGQPREVVGRRVRANIEVLREPLKTVSDDREPANYADVRVMPMLAAGSGCWGGRLL